MRDLFLISSKLKKENIHFQGDENIRPLTQKDVRRAVINQVVIHHAGKAKSSKKQIVVILLGFYCDLKSDVM